MAPKAIYHNYYSSGILPSYYTVVIFRNYKGM